MSVVNRIPDRISPVKYLQIFYLRHRLMSFYPLSSPSHPVESLDLVHSRQLRFHLFFVNILSSLPLFSRIFTRLTLKLVTNSTFTGKG